MRRVIGAIWLAAWVLVLMFLLDVWSKLLFKTMQISVAVFPADFALLGEPNCPLC